MMNELDMVLVENTQESSYKKKTKKLRKRHREELRQPVVSSDLLSHSSQDTGDSQPSRKKHKKKKSSTEATDYQADTSWVIPETQLSDEPEINNFVPKKKKKKMKHRLKQGGDDEFWSPPTEKKSRKPSRKEDLENGGGVKDDEFWNLSTPKKSRKLSQNEDLENGGVVDGNMSSLKKKNKKKKRKRREDVDVSDGPAKEKVEATSSQQEDQVDLNETIDTQMDLFASSPLSFSERAQLDLLQGNGQEGTHSPTAEDSDATQMDLETEQKQPQSPSKLSTSEVNTKLGQSQTGRKLRSSRKRPPSETDSVDEVRDFSVLNKEQLADARKELEEFLPRAKTLSDEAIRKLAIRDLPRFREFKKKGLKVKFGVFSQAENDLLVENMAAFLEISGVDTAEKLLFSHRFPAEEAEIKRLKLKYSFCERIARGIARPWRLVYYRARKIFDPQNYNGWYTKEEKKQLFKYHAMYGNRWKKISGLMNRSSHSIALKYNEMVEVFNTGPWTPEETGRLLQALRDILRTKVSGLDSALEKRDGDGALTLLRENLYKNIGWVKVAAKVETRNWSQCKKKWMSILTKKMTGKSRLSGLNNLQFKIDLIERLYELNVADTSEVDWEQIAGAIGNAPPEYVQSRYYRLKSSHVPFWYEKTFPEIIDYLFEETLPDLKKNRKRMIRRRRNPQEEKSCKTSFRFNDIFQDLLEEEELSSEDDSEEVTGETSQADG
ncbi:transcription termination factor 1 [Crotalus tigris]|uniref:transcription termination factor 1 n=1 Tax=Crotalus tigris TaxID=88082 RepID=UPI00192F5144|nr:transcription termination factor 1 [Crotalus tigris]XP_039178945.1 transcription termination factor 1 [Crotalus tigris]